MSVWSLQISWFAIEIWKLHCRNIVVVETRRSFDILLQINFPPSIYMSGFSVIFLFFPLAVLSSISRFQSIVFVWYFTARILRNLRYLLLASTLFHCIRDHHYSVFSQCLVKTNITGSLWDKLETIDIAFISKLLLPKFIYKINGIAMLQRIQMSRIWMARTWLGHYLPACALHLGLNIVLRKRSRYWRGFPNAW